MTSASYMIDVSAYQGRRNWARTGAHAGMAKATEGQHTRDTRFAGHITDIKAAGLVPGAYHFAWPNQSAVAEAANYVAAVRPHRVPGFVHVLDLERNKNGENYARVNAAEIRTYASRWIDGVRAAFPHDRIGIYTSGSDLAAGHYPANSDFLWYPAYPDALKNAGIATAVQHARPEPSGRTVWGWQYTSTPEDRSVIYLSPAALVAWARGTAAPTKEPENDMPEPKDLWSYKGTNPKTPGKGVDPHDAYAYLRGTNADVRTLGSRLTAMNNTLQTMAATITELAKAKAGDSTAVVGGLNRMADALFQIAGANDVNLTGVREDGGTGDGE